MHFTQLVEIIPVLDQISAHSSTRIVDCAEDCHALIVVRRGSVTVSSRKQPPAVCEQAYACHPRFGPFVVEVPNMKKAEYVIILYRILPKSSEWTLNGSLHTISEIKIDYMVDEMLRTAQTQATEDYTEEKAAVQQFRLRIMLERILFIYLYESCFKIAKRPSGLAIEESLSYINEHYMLKLTLPMLAHRAGVSDGHYTVLFKKHTGTSFIQYLHQIRIEKAKQLFWHTDLSAKEIAQKVGFNDYFHFSKTFKKLAGTSPTNFRQNQPEF